MTGVNVAQSRRKIAERIRTSPDDRPPAVIAGIGSNGLGFLRSLGRRGILCVALDSWRDPGTHSRYGLPLVVPDPERDERGLLDLLLEIGDETPVRSVLIPTTDAFILFVSKHHGELSDHYQFNVADHESVLTLANKRLQYEYARRQGIEAPVTFFPEDVGIEEIASETDYPCIIKPYLSHLWRAYGGNRWGKVAEVQTARELIDTYSEMKESGLDFMVQEKIAGAEDHLYGLITYLDRSSEPVAIFTKHKVRQYPTNFGDGSLHIAVRVPDVAKLGLRLIQGLNFRGIAHVEFKRDPLDGHFKLIEVNPRSSAATYHAVASGVDIPYIAYQDSRGEQAEKAFTFREGVKWINLEKDFRSFLEHRRAGDLSLRGWLTSLRGPRCFAFFTWDDPLPAWYGLREFGLTELQKKRRSAASAHSPR